MSGRVTEVQRIESLLAAVYMQHDDYKVTTDLIRAMAEAVVAAPHMREGEAVLPRSYASDDALTWRGNGRSYSVVREDNGSFSFVVSHGRAIELVGEEMSFPPKADAVDLELANEQCIAIYDAVTQCNFTRDVKTDARKCGVVRGASVSAYLDSSRSKP